MNYLMALILLLQVAYAQSHSGDLDAPEFSTLKQEGQLFSVRVRLGEPLRIFVVGREEAKLDLSNLKVTVRRLEPYPVHTLLVTKQGDFFTVPQATGPDTTTSLEVKTKLKGLEETFKFKIENKQL